MTQMFASENIRYMEVSELLLGDYLVMVNDLERVGRLIGRTAPISEQQGLRWIRKKLEKQDPIFSMLEQKTGDFIGNVELKDSDGTTAELGIAITAAKQDMGYGTEAVAAVVRYGFETLGLCRIFLKAFPGNDRAIHVYQKCGFTEYDRTEQDVYMEIRR